MGRKRTTRSASHSAGFTLIELLVVIAIIGLLASIILGSLTLSQRKGRDARRLQDIQSLQQALALYSSKHSSYPIALSVLLTDGDIQALPTDPGGGTQYAYTPYGSTVIGTIACTGYHLGAVMEQGSYTGVKQASQGTGSVCGGSANYYNGTASNGRGDTLSASNGDFNGTASFTDGAYVYDITP